MSKGLSCAHGVHAQTQTHTNNRALVLLNLGRALAHTQRTHERHNEQQQQRCSRQPHRRGTSKDVRAHVARLSKTSRAGRSRVEQSRAEDNEKSIAEVG